MRVFVTGASGFVGSAIVKNLIKNGHQVLGLARSDESTRQLVAAGAEVHRGSLNDLESLQAGALAADGVIHTAFIHDFTDYAAHCETDRKVIEAFGSVLEGTDKPLIITSGIGILPPGKLIVESDVPDTGTAVIPRVASEEAAAAVRAKGVKASAVRLPPSVHDKGDHGFVPTLINVAREKGIAAYVGDGSNRWPAVYRPDAAELYRLILENGATEQHYHAVGEQGIPHERDCRNDR